MLGLARGAAAQPRRTETNARSAALRFGVRLLLLVRRNMTHLKRGLAGSSRRPLHQHYTSERGTVPDID